MPTPANFELPVINPKPRKPGTFGRGNPPPSNGRRPGQVNKITADLKQGILRGAANCGYDGAGLGGVDGFLLMCAQRHPKHYLALLGKMLPLNLNANVASASINEVRIISVPTDCYLSRADIEKLQSQPELLERTAPPGSVTPPPEPAPFEEPARFEEPIAQEIEMQPPEDDYDNMPIEELMRRAGATRVG
jgi:hypothetical protein